MVQTDVDSLHRFYKIFKQYLVAVHGNSLIWIHNKQAPLGADTNNGLCDAIAADIVERAGKSVIIPSSWHCAGSPRYMYQTYLDAIAIAGSSRYIRQTSLCHCHCRHAPNISRCHCHCRQSPLLAPNTFHDRSHCRQSPPNTGPLKSWTNTGQSPLHAPNTSHISMLRPLLAVPTTCTEHISL